MGYVELVEEPGLHGMRPADEWELLKLVEEPGRDGADARRDGEMHLLHPAHPAGRNRAKGQGAGHRATSKCPRARFQDGLPAGVPGGGDCVRRHQRPGQPRFPAQGAAAQLHAAGFAAPSRARPTWRASAIPTRACRITTSRPLGGIRGPEGNRAHLEEDGESDAGPTSSKAKVSAKRLECAASGAFPGPRSQAPELALKTLRFEHAEEGKL